MLATPAGTRDAVRALRRARRRRRLHDVDWIDVLYKVYVAALASLASLFTAAAFVGDTRLDPSAVHDVQVHGPVWVGLAVAVVLAMGLRSGSRGGPLALEGPDVTWVLLAPIDRATVLRGAAFRQVRGIVLVGLVGGVLAGDLAAQRLSGGAASDFAAWVATGAVLGLALTLAAWGAALVGSGLRVPRSLAAGIGVVLVGWSLLDAATDLATSPATWVGRFAVTPLDFSVLGIVGIVLLLAVPVVGLAVVGGTSIEVAERRAGLVGQLRFAATIQDVRAVIVLHRQLAHEQSRGRPWLRLGEPGPDSRPTWRRGWQGALRWPLARVARIGALGAIAGASLVGVWRGTTPLIVVAALALTLAAFDAIEPLAQETDHPDRLVGVPVRAGEIYARLLVVPVCVMAIAGLVGLAVALVLEPHATTLALGLAVVVTGAVAAVAGAALSIVLGAPGVGSGFALSFPEMATMGHILRQAAPALLCMAAVAPVIVARELASDHQPSLAPALWVCVPALAVAMGIVTWVRSRRSAVE